MKCNNILFNCKATNAIKCIFATQCYTLNLKSHKILVHMHLFQIEWISKPGGQPAGGSHSIIIFEYLLHVLRRLWGHCMHAKMYNLRDCNLNSEIPNTFSSQLIGYAYETYLQHKYYTENS